jgi:hypothetical protein
MTFIKYLRIGVKKYNRLRKYLSFKPFKPLKTEDLGKTFEMSICSLYNISFVGTFKYNLTEAKKLTYRIKNLLTIFPYKLDHTAKNGSPFDFTCVDNPYITLSAKTTKKGNKVCPQVIGQPTKKTFCQYFGIDNNSTSDYIKEYIENNVSFILYKYFENTFDQPIVYYNEERDLLLFVRNCSDIDWYIHNIEFSHKQKYKKWIESTTIRINGTSIGEFQIHKNRDNIKFRWYFENVLEKFSTHFVIVKL